MKHVFLNLSLVVMCMALLTACAYYDYPDQSGPRADGRVVYHDQGYYDDADHGHHLHDHNNDYDDNTRYHHWDSDSYPENCTPADARQGRC